MAKKTKGLIFSGALLRHGGGHTIAEAETAEQARELVQRGDRPELDTVSGEANSERDRQQPHKDREPLGWLRANSAAS